MRTCNRCDTGPSNVKRNSPNDVVVPNALVENRFTNLHQKKEQHERVEDCKDRKQAQQSKILWEKIPKNKKNWILFVINDMLCFVSKNSKGSIFLA